MSKFLSIFKALFPIINAAVPAAEEAIGAGNGAQKFNFVLGFTQAAISTIPDFQLAFKEHSAADINLAAGDAINLIVAGLNAAGKLGKPAPTTPPALVPAQGVSNG